MVAHSWLFLIHVSAKEKCTGLEKNIVITNAISQFTDLEIQDAKKRIEKLFETEFLESESSNTIEGISTTQKNTALAAIEKAKQVLSVVIVEDREDITVLMDAMTRALNEDNVQSLLEAQDQLLDIVFYVDAAV